MIIRQGTPQLRAYDYNGHRYRNFVTVAFKFSLSATTPAVLASDKIDDPRVEVACLRDAQNRRRQALVQHYRQ